MLMVVVADDVCYGIYTSGVDAAERAKRIPGARVYRCAPNSDAAVCVGGKKNKEEPEE